MLRSEPNSLKTGAVVVTRLGLSGDMVCVCVCVCVFVGRHVYRGRVPRRQESNCLLCKNLTCHITIASCRVKIEASGFGTSCGTLFPFILLQLITKLLTATTLTLSQSPYHSSSH